MEVQKDIPVRLDLGNLAVFDINRLDEVVKSKNKTDRDAYVMSLTRDNMQLLINDLFKLPATPSDVGALAKLPEPSTLLPRSKPVPKPREPTRWEQFAKAKGIVKRKRSSHAYDEQQQEWRPRYGRKSAKNDGMKDWCMELKPGQEIPQDD